MRLTEGDFHVGQPSWSPDGRQLAFTAGMEPDGDLNFSSSVYTVEVTGGDPKRLTGVWWLGERLVVTGLLSLVGHTRLSTLEPAGLVELETGLDRNVMTGGPHNAWAPVFDGAHLYHQVLAMTCWLTTRTGRFKAAVPGGAVTDLTSTRGTSDMGYLLTKFECGDDVVAQSPFTHVADVTTPTLILHGENDDRCPVSQAEQWFTALREQSVPVRLVRYPGASHLFLLDGRPSHRLDYNERIIAWLEQWVTGSPS